MKLPQAQSALIDSDQISCRKEDQTGTWRDDDPVKQDAVHPQENVISTCCFYSIALLFRNQDWDHDFIKSETSSISLILQSDKRSSFPSKHQKFRLVHESIENLSPTICVLNESFAVMNLNLVSRFECFSSNIYAELIKQKDFCVLKQVGETKLKIPLSSIFN